MLESENYVCHILRDNSNSDEFWEFFTLYDSNGKSLPQAKDYGKGYVSYPDFEMYKNKKLTLLVEVKGYDGYFDGIKDALAMKLSCFTSYQTVLIKEKVNIRICFVIRFHNEETMVYWEDLKNIVKFPFKIKRRTYYEKDYDTKEVVKKVGDFIYWNTEKFRIDEENIGKV